MEKREVWGRWLRALILAAAMMAAIFAFAIPVNLALGRVIHWDIVTGLGLEAWRHSRFWTASAVSMNWLVTVGLL